MDVGANKSERVIFQREMVSKEMQKLMMRE